MTYDFTVYRQQRGYSAKSIKGQDRQVNLFKKWCGENSITLENITYNQALQFIDNERERGILNQSVINKINSIRIYFDYLKESGMATQNVFKRIKIRKGGKKTLPQTLTSQQLENIYCHFTHLPEWEHGNERIKELHKRNVVLLGLLVFQGLTSSDTGRLETKHINLLEGKIYIQSSRKGNARTLKLQANQILPLKSYLEEFNPQPYLFPAKKHSDLVCKIVQQAKKRNPEIINSRQIRASVIMNWLKTNNIRQVQYMAGHKSIASTEQYRNQDLTDLAKQLELFHPLQ